MARFRHGTLKRKESSFVQLRKALREKEFVHQCPKCKKLFPSKDKSFGRSMGIHVRYCQDIQAQPPEGKDLEIERDDEEEWEDILLDGRIDQGDGDGAVEFDQDWCLGQDQSGEESWQLDSMGEKMRQEMFSLKEDQGSTIGGIEELFEDGDFGGESCSDTSEEDETMSSGASREFCGAQVFQVNTSDLDVQPTNWRPNLMSNPGRVKGEKYSKEEFLRAEGERCRLRAERAGEKAGTRPSRKFLRYQERVRAEYLPPPVGVGGREDPGPFQRFNKVDGTGKDFRDIILLNHFMNKNGMSEEEGDDLLRLIFDIAGNNKWKWPMYQSSRRLKKLCEKKMLSLHSVRIMTWALPRNMFGASRDSALGRRAAAAVDNLAPAVGAGREIMQAISLRLALLERPDDFILGYQELSRPHPVSGMRERVISAWPSGNVAHNLNKSIEHEFGPGHYALAIALSFDVTASYSGKTTLFPLNMNILNMVGVSDIVIPLAHIPTKFMQSKAEIDALLLSNGVEAKVTRELVIKEAKRKMCFDFLHHVQTDIEPWQRDGVELSIGLGPMAQKAIFHPFVVKWVVDGDEAAEFLGVHCKNEVECCRICFDPFWYSCPRRTMGDVVVRDSRFVCQLRLCSEQILVQELNGVKVAPGVKKAVKDGMKHYGVYGHFNVNYAIGDLLERRGVTTMHRMMPPDKLHVVLHHLFEALIGYTVQLALVMADPLFNGGIDKRPAIRGLLNRLTRDFPYVQGYSPVRSYKPDGVMQYMSAASQENDALAHSTGKIKSE